MTLYDRVQGDAQMWDWSGVQPGDACAVNPMQAARIRTAETLSEWNPAFAMWYSVALPAAASKPYARKRAKDD